MVKRQQGLFIATAEAVGTIASDALQVAIETASAIGSSLAGGVANAIGMSDAANVKSESRVKKISPRWKAKTRSANSVVKMAAMPLRGSKAHATKKATKSATKRTASHSRGPKTTDRTIR